MTTDLQRKKHCDHCHLAFGLREKREPFGDLAVHKEPCLTTLQHRANLRTERVGTSTFARQTYQNPCTN